MKRKIYNTIAVSIIVLITYLFVSYAYTQNKNTVYCGKVRYKYSTSAGYKVSERKHIVFYSDSLKRLIDVSVSNGEYANTDTSQHEVVCYGLSKMWFQQNDY